MRFVPPGFVVKEESVAKSYEVSEEERARRRKNICEWAKKGSIDVQCFLWWWSVWTFGHRDDP